MQGELAANEKPGGGPRLRERHHPHARPFTPAGPSFPLNREMRPAMHGGRVSAALAWACCTALCCCLPALAAAAAAAALSAPRPLPPPPPAVEPASISIGPSASELLAGRLAGASALTGAPGVAGVTPDPSLLTVTAFQGPADAPQPATPAPGSAAAAGAAATQPGCPCEDTPPPSGNCTALRDAGSWCAASSSQCLATPPQTADISVQLAPVSCRTMQCTFDRLCNLHHHCLSDSMPSYFQPPTPWFHWAPAVLPPGSWAPTTAHLPAGAAPAPGSVCAPMCRQMGATPARSRHA